MADKDTGAEEESHQMGTTPNQAIQSKFVTVQTGTMPSQPTEEGQVAQTGRRMENEPTIEPYVPWNFNWYYYYPPYVAVPPNHPPPNRLLRYMQCLTTNKFGNLPLS
jgi:hypothetical protein